MGLGGLAGILDNTIVEYLDSYSGCFDTFLATILPIFNRDTAHGLDGMIVKDAHTPNHINGQVSVPASSKGRQLLTDEPPQPVQILNEEMVGFYAPY